MEIDEFKRSKINRIFEAEAEVRVFREEFRSLAKMSKWRDAADELVNIAKRFSTYPLKLTLHSAGFYAQAAELYEAVDMMEAARAFESASRIYSDLGYFNISGRLEGRIAQIHYMNKHWEEAASHFRKAANFLAGEKLLDQSDRFLEMTAKCVIRMNNFAEASKLYFAIAKSCARTNLRMFNARDHLLKAIIYLFGLPVDVRVEEVKEIEEAHSLFERNKAKALKLATLERKKQKMLNKKQQKDDPASEADAPLDLGDYAGEFERPMRRSQIKYDDIKYQFESCNKIDFMWYTSIEKRFLNNILTARAELDDSTFVDHIYFFNTVRPLDVYCMNALKEALREIPAEREVLKYMKDAKRRREEEEKKENL